MSLQRLLDTSFMGIIYVGTALLGCAWIYLLVSILRN